MDFVCSIQFTFDPRNQFQKLLFLANPPVLPLNQSPSTTKMATIDDYTAIFHDGSLTSQGGAHFALDRLATCIVDKDLESFLNRLLSSSCHTTPLLIELILSCKYYLRCDLVFTIADF